MGWYNYHCNKLTKTDYTNATSQLLTQLTQRANRPYKLSLVQFYLREHYDERIIKHFDERWAIVETAYEERKAAAATSSAPFEEDPPQKVAVRTVAAKEQWDKETEEFRESVRVAWEAWWAKELADYAKLQEPPSCAEDYQE